MDTFELERAFARMGARVRIEAPTRNRFGFLDRPPNTVDVGRDRRGEHFLLVLDAATTADVIDVRSRDRHLLLMLRTPSPTGVPSVNEDARRGGQFRRSVAWIPPRFLCGHDERAWFVAAIPEEARAADVPRAMEALKPPMVREAQERAGLRRRDRSRRRNAAFVRQGEWFFLPRPERSFPQATCLRHEPLRRGNGKPHIAEWCARFGGQTVFVGPGEPNGISEQAFFRRWRNEPTFRRNDWRSMRADMQVFVRGRVRHPDHATIVLKCWHEVVMNTENLAAAMKHVRFVD